MISSVPSVQCVWAIANHAAYVGILNQLLGETRVMGIQTRLDAVEDVRDLTDAAGLHLHHGKPHARELRLGREL
eukprot:8921664-Pyramimonas_sp.AAC.1